MKLLPLTQGKFAKVDDIDFVPDLSYDGLAIRDGAAGMAAYKRLRSPGLADAERGGPQGLLRLGHAGHGPHPGASRERSGHARGQASMRNRFRSPTKASETAIQALVLGMASGTTRGIGVSLSPFRPCRFKADVPDHLQAQ